MSVNDSFIYFNEDGDTWWRDLVVQQTNLKRPHVAFTCNLYSNLSVREQHICLCRAASNERNQSGSSRWSVVVCI